MTRIAQVEAARIEGSNVHTRSCDGIQVLIEALLGGELSGIGKVVEELVRFDFVVVEA